MAVGKTDTGADNASTIMRQVHELYTRADEGVVALARSVGVSTIHSPRRKVNVLVIGNHSAGKSSFINWYIGDDVQRTGVAIETQGFTFVTSGTKKTLAPIKGDSTVMLYPYLEPLKAKFGKPLVENLQTCVSVSTKRSFPMVDFIDSPGLVDGDIMYPFDVNEAIVSFADSADLVFVFMDPMGQALCSRTMNVVKLLNARHFDKLKYYLSKADTVTNPKELMKLMVQITQNIKENINNQHGLEIPAIWLPPKQPRQHAAQESNDRVADDVNQISELCATIDQAIHQKVQDNLSQVELDCRAVLAQTQALLAKDELEIAARRSREVVAVFFAISAWLIPLVAFLTLMVECEEHLPSAVRDAEYVMPAVHVAYSVFQPLLFPERAKPDLLTLLKLFGLSVLAFLVLNAVSSFTRSRAKKFTPQKRSVIAKWKSHEQIVQRILERRQALFLEYVRTYTAAEDL
ncbi:hypothetical protein PybrP1_006554 [[Pythium] brassicae (nom. inval.)]|nr:hypothetical protein PybrP1_006554 [[Pythium] brassicae (nom. inval.)]